MKYAAPALLLGLIFFSCKKKDEVPLPKAEAPAAASADTRIVATVNGDPITLAEFQERFARAGFKEREVEFSVKEDFLNRLIERIMLVREAQRRRIKISQPEISQRIESIRTDNGKDVKQSLASMGVDFEKWKADVWEDLMIERLLARDVDKRAAVSAAEVRKYYQMNLQEFEKPEQVRVRQIVTATEADAQQALNELNAGKDFAAVARAKSTAPESERGGDLGYFSMGDMPGEFNVVFGMQKGGVSDIIKSPYGYHIFKLEDRRKAGRISLDEAYRDIAERLRKEKADRRYEAWITELRARTKFEVNYDALR